MVKTGQTRTQERKSAQKARRKLSKSNYAPHEDKEVDYEILDKNYPIIEWKTEYLGTKPQVDKAKHLEEINQNVVIRSNGQKRYFSTLMRVLSIFDRDYLNAVYQLRDNNVSVDFDAYGFSVKDYQTRRLLLRCAFIEPHHMA
ncbi:hypothetical protein Tco_0374714 [Tanacetum coccineum]